MTKEASSLHLLEQPPRKSPSRWPKIALALVLVLATVVTYSPQLRSSQWGREDCHSGSGVLDPNAKVYDDEWLKEHSKCPKQPPALHPKIKWDLTEEEQTESLRKFSEAVQIPTESFDDNGEPNEDPRWKPFFRFQTWLKETFPLANDVAEVEYVNTLGILATFHGSDSSLKPLLLMSHYDVVPAPNSSADQWTHPPFSGHNDGTFIWGRGAMDDKNLLVAQWDAVNHLLETGWRPRRTLILSHGFDEEEVVARRGQGHIAPLLEKRYGKNSILMVIDEGSEWTDDFYGAPFALPATGEKGYLDIKITVGTTGGHSSVPPEHTGIGLAAQIVNALEENPFPVKLTPSSPLLAGLHCASEYAKLPHKWSSLLKKEGPKSYPRLARSFAKDSPANKALVGTTMAVDVLQGGVKVNALPEIVTVLINFRIDFSESVASTQHHVADILANVAKKFNLRFSAFDDKNPSELGQSYIKVENFGPALEPAPLSPTDNGVWELFAGTVKATHLGPDGRELIVAPWATTGNTDCKMYYNLTKNVYRYAGGREGSKSMHTVDERALIKAHFDIVAWIHAIVQNADAYTGEE